MSINEKKIRDCYQEFTDVLNLIHTNMKGTYNRLAKICLSKEDVSKGVEFPEVISTEIQMKGLEFFFAKEKKDQE